jgi:cobalt-zinc-cadmium resistance protein CzcA
MFQSIVRFAVTKKLFVGLTTLFLLAGGIYSMMTLPVDAVPDITNNQVQIVTVSPTLAPQEVEQLITFPIEVAMSNIMNVQEIRSVSRFGLSVVTVVFKESVPILDARQLINEQIQTVAGEIPSELGTPEMMPITTGLGEIYQYTLDVEPGYEKRYDAMELRAPSRTGLSSASCRASRESSKSTASEATSSSMRWPSTPTLSTRSTSPSATSSRR